MYGDSQFVSGYNNVIAYVNDVKYTDNIQLERKQMTTNFGTSYALEITTTGKVEPGLGGIVQHTQPTAFNEVYVHFIVAKVPKGYTLNIAANYLGEGKQQFWISDNKGTGNWKEYAYVTQIGSSLASGKSLGTFGHIYLDTETGKNYTYPVTWYISQIHMYKVDASLGFRYFFSLSDNIGVTGWAINQSTSAPTSWTGITSSTQAMATTNPSTAGTYRVWVKDASGRTASATFKK